MKVWEGYMKGVNLGGWISQYAKYDEEHFRSFITEADFPEINRKLTSFEYNKVTEHCADLGLEGFMQEKGCDTLDMTPDF